MWPWLIVLIVVLEWGLGAQAINKAPRDEDWSALREWARPHLANVDVIQVRPDYLQPHARLALGDLAGNARFEYGREASASRVLVIDGASKSTKDGFRSKRLHAYFVEQPQDAYEVFDFDAHFRQALVFRQQGLSEVRCAMRHGRPKRGGLFDDSMPAGSYAQCGNAKEPWVGPTYMTDKALVARHCIMQPPQHHGAYRIRYRNLPAADWLEVSAGNAYTQAHAGDESPVRLTVRRQNEVHELEFGGRAKWQYQRVTLDGKASATIDFEVTSQVSDKKYFCWSARLMNRGSR